MLVKRTDGCGRKTLAEDDGGCDQLNKHHEPGMHGKSSPGERSYPLVA